MNVNNTPKEVGSVSKMVYTTILDGGNIDEYYSRNYSDGRNIYAETQISYNDPVFLYQRKVEEAVDEVIRAEEHLRRVRGY